jgi:hypothetical protein
MARAVQSCVPIACEIRRRFFPIENVFVRVAVRALSPVTIRMGEGSATHETRMFLESVFLRVTLFQRTDVLRSTAQPRQVRSSGFSDPASLLPEIKL